jgi:hypothetical protein
MTGRGVRVLLGSLISLFSCGTIFRLALRRRTSGTPEASALLDREFLRIALQYYVAGRSAAFALAMPVAGNLFHHAVEMLLKSYLLAQHSPDDLTKKYRHNLKRLWRDFKSRHGGGVVTRFDPVISALDRLEDLRYPQRSYTFLLELAKPSVPPLPLPARHKPSRLPHYQVYLEEIDELLRIR